MSTFTEEGYLRQKARALCKGLSVRLDDYVNEFPAGQPSELIGTIKLFLRQLEQEIASQADPNLLRFNCLLIHQLSTVLDWLDNAHTAQSPRGIVQCLNSTSQKLFGKAVSVLVSPSINYNYSIKDVVPPLRDLATRALSASLRQPVLDRLQGSFYVVRFPRIERDNVLIHAIFGHEFGHPIADEFMAQHEKTTDFQKRFQIAQQKILADPTIAARLAQHTNALERQRLAHSIFDEIAQIHKRGIQELVSDAFGTYLFGPSALFASLDVLVQMPPDDPPNPPQFYPPNRYRWRFVRDILSKEGHLQCLRSLSLPPELSYVRDATEAALQYIDGVVSADVDLKAIEKEPVVRTAYEWLDDTLQDALNYASARAVDLTYAPDTAVREIPELLQRLALNVPPCEVGIWPDVACVDWRSSLLAGWLFAIARIANPQSHADDQQKIITTNQRLTLKGIEHALLRNEFDQFIQGKKSV